ncbi:hypothetical protein AB3R30_23290 [Leptolyngbyaceae cyanobacterium UHCC 1019]
MVDQFYGGAPPEFSTTNENTRYEGASAVIAPSEPDAGYLKRTAHGLTALAIAAVFTFVIPSDPNNRWFWNLLQWGGLTSAFAAVALYSKVEEEEEKLQNSLEMQVQEAITTTATRLKQQYESHLYQLQLQHQDDRQTIHQQYLAAAQAQVDQLTYRHQQQLGQFRTQMEHSQGDATLWQQQVEALNLELTQVQSAALEQLNQERDNIALKEMQFQRQQEQLELERQQLQAEHQQLDHWLAEQRQSLTQQKEALESREVTLETSLAQQYQEHLQELQTREQALRDLELAFDVQLEQRVLAEETRLKELEAQMMANFERLWSEREQLYSALANKAMTEAYQLKQPDKTPGATHEELLADKVIDLLYRHGIIAKRPVVEPKPHNQFDLTFTILPIDPVLNQNRGDDEPEYITNLVDAFKLIQTKLLDGIKNVVNGCASKPQAEMVYGGIQLAIDISGIDWEAQAQERKRAKEPQVLEAEPDWLLVVAEIGNHFRITGPTDSGKSALADNLVGSLQAVFGTLSVTLADPKYPFTEWTTFQPNFKGSEECLVGVGKLERLVDSRFIQARLDKDAGRAIREFPAELFALDEAEILMDEARLRDDIDPPGRGQLSMQRNLARMLRKGLKLGRGLTKKKGKGLKVLYVAQSPLCSRLGLNRDDFDQSVNIFIGENIPRALEEELKGKVSSTDKEFWLAQYHLRVARGDSYFCLVKMPGKRPFIASMPTPATYAVNGVTTSQLSEPEAVDGTIGDEELDAINPDDQTRPKTTFDSSHPSADSEVDQVEDSPLGEFDLKLPYLNNLPPEQVAQLLQGLGFNQGEDSSQDDLKASSDNSLGQVDQGFSEDQDWQPDEVDRSSSDIPPPEAGFDQVDQVGEVERLGEDGKVSPPFNPQNTDLTSATNLDQSSPSFPATPTSDVAREIDSLYVLPWSSTAKPGRLFESAKGRITQLIGQGYTKPFEICTAIWGNAINPHSKPYNGKGGVKNLVEKLIKDMNQ